VACPGEKPRTDLPTTFTCAEAKTELRTDFVLPLLPSTAVLHELQLGSGALGRSFTKRTFSFLWILTLTLSPIKDTMYNFLTHLAEAGSQLLNNMFGGIVVGSNIWLILLVINVAVGCFFVMAMMGGPGHGGRNHHMPAGTATLKQPPSWGPEQAQHYPFVQYVNDVMLWSLATDMDRMRQAPAVAMQLTGAARMVARQIMESPNGMALLQQGEQHEF